MIAANRETQQPKHRAFIAYSHKDEAHTRHLHRALESFPITRRLRGRESLST